LLIAGQLITPCWDCGKVVVENDMVLRRNMLCAWIENERDVGEVIWREADEDSLTGLAVPFWDWFVVLEFGIQHINRAAEDVGTGERGSPAFRLVPQFFRGPASATWREMIVNPNGVGNRKWPEIKEGETGPLHRCV
jgi:hypothetical protein